MSILSERLIQLKEEQGLFQKAIAEKTGISISAYQRYEKGEQEPTTSGLIRIADFFGVSMDYLMGRTDKREINK